MAQLNRLDRPAAIPATTQLTAIAWLRWRMFANNFRRSQNAPGGAGRLIGTILLRVMIWPIFAMMGLAPVIGAGYLGWTFVHDHHPEYLTALLAGVVLLWQFVAINGTGIATAMASFDPSSLLRYPLRFGRYMLLRLLLGILTPSTIVGTLALFAAAIGIAVADHTLALPALVVLAIYAATNIFLARTIAAWMERLLATRRAREIFGALMALFFLSFQLLNFRNGAHHHAANVTWILRLMHTTSHVLDWLPPGFATNAILHGNPLARLGQFAALLVWTALFFATFAFRLHKQFLGEYLSEGAPRSTAQPRSRHATVVAMPDSSTFFSPVIAACLRKEWLYFRGNNGMLVQLITPLIFVFILSRGMLAHHPDYLLSGCVGYALLGPIGGLYNIFGADAAGVQIYLLAPIRLRDVILAKNIASLILLIVEAALVWCVVLLLSSTPIPAVAQISAGLWLVFVVATNLTFGTLRSIQAPRKVPLPGQARSLRPQTASKTAGLLVLALLVGSLLLQVPVTMLCRHFHNPWLAIAIFAPLAAAAMAAYGLLLSHTERLVYTHRDRFAEELCGA